MPEMIMRTANDLYESGMDAVTSSESTLYYAVGEDGSRRLLPIGRWLTQAPEDEERLLDRATGPVRI